MEALDTIAAGNYGCTVDMLPFAMFNVDMVAAGATEYDAEGKRLFPNEKSKLLWKFEPTSNEKLDKLNSEFKPVQFGKVDGERVIVSGDPKRIARLEYLAAEYAMGDEQYEHPIDPEALAYGVVAAIIRQRADDKGSLPTLEEMSDLG